MTTPKRVSATPVGIDWEKVAEENPEAYEALKKYCKSINFAEFGTFEELISKRIEYLIGHLLAFFDGHRINIFTPEIGENVDQWSPRINAPGVIWYAVKDGVPRYYDTRPQALAAAFTEAFRILEEKIGGDA